MWNKQGKKMDHIYYYYILLIYYYCHLFTNVNICKVEKEVCENSVKIKVYFAK